MYPSVEAFLHDLDGTLIESEEALQHSLEDVLVEHGCDVSRLNYSEIIGLPEDDKVRVVLASFGLTVDARTFYDRLTALTHERLSREMRLRSGAVRFLEKCVATGAPRGLVTSATAWHANFALDKFDLRRFYHPGCIITAETEGLTGRKPDPAPYLMAAKRLGVSPRRCIVAEDSRNGVAAALAAGMVVLAVPKTPESIAALVAAGGVYVLPPGQNIGDFEVADIAHLLPPYYR